VVRVGDPAHDRQAEAGPGQGPRLGRPVEAIEDVRQGFAYGYQGDVATGPDQLGVQGDVNAVCEVIVDPEVKPPLAVGLFGRWGTGKSFFMDKMRERVAELTTGSSSIASWPPAWSPETIPTCG
jgi:hypothetical protein